LSQLERVEKIQRERDDYVMGILIKSRKYSEERDEKFMAFLYPNPSQLSIEEG